MKKIWIVLIALTCSICMADQATVNVIEKNIIAHIEQSQTDALSLLEKIVNINSGTDNVVGVYEVGNLLQKEFEALGFKGEWKNPPDSMQRAGTLFLTMNGNQGPHILLIAHLDTVFSKNSDFQQFTRDGNIAKGPGVIDDKGGIIIMLYALKALHAQGLLNNANITIALVGDEESSGKPVSISRAPLIQAAQNVAITLDFEPAAGNNQATIARRGISLWEIKTTGIEAHSSKVFQPGTGFGAILELARVLDVARAQLGDEPYATFNPGVIIGGTDAQIEPYTTLASGHGKENVVPQIALAQGDIRFISVEEKAFIQKTLQDAAAQGLPNTTSTITFEDSMPPMPPTENNKELLQRYSQVSSDLGFGAITATDPKYRGAADINYVAGIVPANLGGLGAIGANPHTNNEILDIKSMNMSTQRAAVLIYRLITP
jgi:glutamate carboxypeptidase